MTDIPRTLRTYNGIPIQTAKQGDIVRSNVGTMVVKQAYPDGAVRGNCNGREHIFDADAWYHVSRALPETNHEFDNGSATQAEIAEAIRHG